MLTDYEQPTGELPRLMHAFDYPTERHTFDYVPGGSLVWPFVRTAPVGVARLGRRHQARHRLVKR